MMDRIIAFSIYNYICQKGMALFFSLNIWK